MSAVAQHIFSLLSGTQRCRVLYCDIDSGQCLETLHAIRTLCQRSQCSVVRENNDELWFQMGDQRDEKNAAEDVRVVYCCDMKNATHNMRGFAVDAVVVAENLSRIINSDPAADTEHDNIRLREMSARVLTPLTESPHVRFYIVQDETITKLFHLSEIIAQQRSARVFVT